MNFKEDNYENAILEAFEDLGYNRFLGYDILRDKTNPLYMDELEESIRRINFNLSEKAITEAIEKVIRFENDSLLNINKKFTSYIQDGVPVTYYDDGKIKNDIVYLVDYDNVDNNIFTVINQWGVAGKQNHRPDIIVFLNGIPVVVFELKSPSREQTDSSEAYLQLKTYQDNIPTLFYYNAFNVMSDMALSKAGTITSDETRYMEWKTKEGSYENTQHAQFDTFIEGIFKKDRLIDIIKNFICFSGDSKILAGYHQYFSVKKAVDSTIKATKTDGRGGVFWHTQGSGKSLSMVFYTHLLQKRLNSATILVITDRIDLDNQLFGQFSKCTDFLRQTPVQAKSREDLQNLLRGRQAHGIIFTTMQKFEETSEILSDRKNIVVISDEAHRSNYGLEEKIGLDGKIHIGAARIIRNQLPNATYIGFTGTPISNEDKDTKMVFGDYIDIYDMNQAVEDGATKPIYYESRVIHLNLDEDILKLIDTEYDILSQQATEYTIERSKKELSRLDVILGAEKTIDSLVDDILKHYEENREYELTGKAMIVAYSREIALKIYKNILQKRPTWGEKVGVIMTSSNKDPEEWREIIGNDKYKKEMAKKFKEDDSPFKIAIVVDMWLTGFDVPSLATMYVYKPMKGHNLMQAIARVNRVYKDKEGGLIVDYIGIANSLKKAISKYTNKGSKDDYEHTGGDIAKIAYPKFLEKLEICRDLFHGFNYSNFMKDNTTDLQRAKLISSGVNFIVGKKDEEYQTIFIKESTLLKKAFQLCKSLLSQKERYEAGYIEAVRTLLTRITNPNKPLSLREINERISELLKATIRSEGVINLFSDVSSSFSLFDPKFLLEISKIEEKNIGVELLKKLLADQVSIYKRTNIVQAEKFSDKLNRTMRSYLNGMLTNEEVIQELLKMAKDMTESSEMAKKLGLTEEELAFYDALTKPEAIKDFYENEQLIAMTYELTTLLRNSRTLDWKLKDKARATMRSKVRRLLKKYDYPPEEADNAMDSIIEQCELWVDEGYDYFESKEYNYSNKFEKIAEYESKKDYDK